jgi:hypothetical protein
MGCSRLGCRVECIGAPTRYLVPKIVKNGIINLRAQRSKIRKWGWLPLLLFASDICRFEKGGDCKDTRRLLRLKSVPKNENKSYAHFTGLFRNAIYVTKTIMIEIVMAIIIMLDN